MPGHNKDNKSQKKFGFSSINPLKRFKTQKRDTMENEKKRKKRPKNYHFGRKKKKNGCKCLVIIRTIKAKIIKDFHQLTP